MLRLAVSLNLFVSVPSSVSVFTIHSPVPEFFHLFSLLYRFTVFVTDRFLYLYAETFCISKSLLYSVPTSVSVFAIHSPVSEFFQFISFSLVYRFTVFVIDRFL